MLRLNTKRAKGQYFTLGNPFTLGPFRQWAEQVELSKKNILEPFAGANNIINSLQNLSLCNEFSSYDVVPCDNGVEYRDTIRSFPKGHSVCVTNPPWLAKNSSTRMGLPYPVTKFDNLYKHCLQLCLSNCEYVAALVPASYLHSLLFRERLSRYILLHDSGMFSDTDNPVCLALFNEDAVADISVYYDNEFIGYLCDLENKIPKPSSSKGVRFNDPNGTLGFISFDSTTEPSIRFCEATEIKKYPVKMSSRFFTRISGEFENTPCLVSRLNRAIDQFRLETRDVFLTPFKGMRKDGNYRRRMDYALARKFVDAS